MRQSSFVCKKKTLVETAILKRCGTQCSEMSQWRSVVISKEHSAFTYKVDRASQLQTEEFWFYCLYVAISLAVSHLFLFSNRINDCPVHAWVKSIQNAVHRDKWRSLRAINGTFILISTIKKPCNHFANVPSSTHQVCTSLLSNTGPSIGSLMSRDSGGHWTVSQGDLLAWRALC